MIDTAKNVEGLKGVKTLARTTIVDVRLSGYRNALKQVVKNPAVHQLNNVDDIARVQGTVNKLAKNVSDLTTASKALKVTGKALGVVGGGLIAVDVVMNSEVRPSDIVNTTMTGLSFVPGAGQIIAVSWFLADFGTGIVTGTSISQRLDNAVGSPAFDW